MTMGFWIRTAAAFVFRSGRTTAALGSVIGISVAALIFVTAVATGVNDCMIKNSTGLYAGQISGTSLPASLSPETLRIPGVTSVLQRYLIPGTAGSAGGGLPLTLVALAPEPEKASSFLWKKVREGTFPVSGGKGILISRQTARDLELGLGEALVFADGAQKCRFRVTGIFETGIPAMDRGMAFCATDAVPRLPETWSAAVFLEPGVSETKVRAGWADRGMDASLFKTWQESMPDLTQLIDLNRISMGFVMVLVLGVVAFATASAFAIAIISRLREYGVMKTMGMTGAETSLLIFFQVVLLNLLAAAAGICLGLAAVRLSAVTGIDLTGLTSHNPYFVVSGVIIPRLTPFSLLLPPGLALAFCLAAAAWPVLIVVRRTPAQILRSI